MDYCKVCPSPHVFETGKEVNHDHFETVDKNICGYRQVLETIHFLKRLSQQERQKFNFVRIKNFSCEISNDEVVNFL